ncbi:MAG: TRAM domain-containing protein, partial [Oligoflexia bacterium]|nr:TRAM domain-containing protein [Oligoflexia bacterium]
RPGTRAYREHGATVDPVLRDVYTRRLMKYQERQKQISLQKNTEMVGNVFEVLTDGISHKDSNKYTGRTATGKVVNFDFAETGDILTGKYTMVKITRAHPTHLTGKEER